MESTIYDGSTLLGTIVGRGHRFKARTVEGRKLGEFPSARDAMSAVIEATRAALNPLSAPEKGREERRRV